MQLPSDAEPPSGSSAGGRAGVLGDFSVFVGNLDPETAVADMEELLYELFLQVLLALGEYIICIVTYGLVGILWARVGTVWQTGYMI